jgi:hypothetical protein
MISYFIIQSSPETSCDVILFYLGGKVNNFTAKFKNICPHALTSPYVENSVEKLLKTLTGLGAAGFPPRAPLS